MNRLIADSSDQSSVRRPLWLIAAGRVLFQSFAFILGVFIGVNVGFILAFMYLVMGGDNP